jgi:O-antigen biosynthesis protein WbqP
MIYKRWAKRCLDVIGAVSVLLVAAPLFFFISALIKVFDPGAIIFRQQRIGRYGRVFTLYKFRSMPEATGDVPSDKIGDIKMTWIGRLIRRLNFDELPQVINILRGEMSIVGPRPSLVSQDELIRKRLEKNVLDIRPGLTGLAQVYACNGMTTDEKVEYDAKYCKTLSLSTDVFIVLKTVVYLLNPPPKY